MNYLYGLDRWFGGIQRSSPPVFVSTHWIINFDEGAASLSPKNSRLKLLRELPRAAILPYDVVAPNA
jgi:hypothetical protein